MSTARPPRIAIVRQKYNSAGGAERFVSRAIAALADQVEVTLITRRWEAHAGLQSLIVDPFYLGNVWRERGFARGVHAAVAQHDFDLVQSHERIPGLALYRAGDGVHREWLIQRARLQSPAKAKLSQLLNPYHRYMLGAEQAMFEHPALRAVICISEMVKQDILRHYQVDPQKLHVIYNGIDTDSWHPRLRDTHREAMRAKLGIARDELTLIFVGSGFERKGLAQALRAVALAKTPARLIVVGRDKHATRYQQLAAQLGIAARVHFAGAQQDVQPYYAAADAFIFPTLYEPFGNVHLEALAMGLPILTAPTAGAAEWVVEGENGFVRDALDVAGFAGAVDRLAAPEHCARLGVAAREAVAPYTPGAMSARLTGLYGRLLNGSDM